MVNAEKGIVADFAELKAALADTNVSIVFLTTDITLSENLVVTHKIDLFGNSKKLVSNNSTVFNGGTNSTLIIQAADTKLIGLTIDVTNADPAGWTTPAYFAVQVYDVTGVELTDVTLSNGDAGLLINAATKDAGATATNLTTIGNEFGGVEVFSAVGQTATFVTNALGNTHTDVAGTPAIWSEGAGTEVVDASYNGAPNPNNVNQIYYTK